MIKEAKTLFEKIWQKHVVQTKAGYPDVLYIDRHFIHEVTSPQAFDGLRKREIRVARPKQTIATADHNVPTVNQHLPIQELLSRHQVDTLIQNCKDFDIELYGLGHEKQGIVHVIGPELGITLPGMTIVCGDSHTSTHGAFGSIAFGIGTSQVEQVLATQSILQYRPKTMKIEINGQLGKGVVSKDIILFIISKISASGGTGYFVEYCGSAIESLSMEARMTICNMSIEMGARGGMIAPDQTTFDYIKGREHAPKGADWDAALAYWKTLKTEKGKKKANDVNVWIVPGSKKVEAQAIQEGLDKVFTAAGFDLRQPGCSACLAMNEDKVPAGKYCVSTSNRNFEGRQGPGSRTFLVSPLMAAAAAVTGEITDVRELL